MRPGIIILILVASTFSYLLSAQESKKPYRKFIKDGIEYQTNGKDTILIVDPMPEFPGGEDQFFEYIANELKYPKRVARQEIKGTVIINFIVGADGNIYDIEIRQGVHTLLDIEAIRVIESMPKWKPGEQNGKPIPVSFTIPINFELK